MALAFRWHRLALVAVFGLGTAVVSAPALAEEGAAAPVSAPGAGCEAGTSREGKRCMHQIAAPGACASARQGSVAGGGGSGGGECGDATIGAATDRFAPTEVALGPGGDGFQPPAPGPGPGPDLQPCDIGCGGPPVGPPVSPPPPGPPAPVITVIESPAPPDPLPGLIK